MRLRTRDTLRDGQKLIVSEILNSKAKLIVSGMGSGKTGATLTALRSLLDTFESRHVLVIAPRFVAMNTWPTEMGEWLHTNGISYAVAVGSPEERAAAIDRRAELTFINFDNIQWLTNHHLRTMKNWYWDTVVIDESSRMKSGEGRTKTTKRRTASGEVKVTKGGNQTRFMLLAIARKKVERIYELTGTPAGQGLIDLWGQVFLLDQGKSLGESKTAFEKQYFYIDKEYHIALGPKPGAEAAILERIKHLVISIPDEKVADEPDFIPVYVDLDSKVMKEYKEFERTLYSEPYDVLAVSSGVLANKLLQFANGHLYQEDRTAVKVHEQKFEALQEIHEASGEESLLIFYSFQFDVAEMKRRIPGLVVANEYKGDLVKDWNEGRIKRLAAHPASIGHGTNLQYGGHIAVWFGLTFSLELYQQACMRLPRPGQKHKVKIYQIIARGTHDEKALRDLSRKDATQERIINYFLTHVKR